MFVNKDKGGNVLCLSVRERYEFVNVNEFVNC